MAIILKQAMDALFKNAKISQKFQNMHQMIR